MKENYYEINIQINRKEDIYLTQIIKTYLPIQINRKNGRQIDSIENNQKVDDPLVDDHDVLMGKKRCLRQKCRNVDRQIGRQIKMDICIAIDNNQTLQGQTTLSWTAMMCCLRLWAVVDVKGQLGHTCLASPCSSYHKGGVKKKKAFLVTSLTNNLCANPIR